MAETQKIKKAKTLWAYIKKCTQCPISFLTENKVFGDGNLSARIFMVGDAPGAAEDACGHPFASSTPTGKILDRALKAAGIRRRETFIANCLKCRPLNKASSVSGNRPPTGAELMECSFFLRAQLKIVKPRVIVALGSSALNTLACPPSSDPIKTTWSVLANFKRFWKTDEHPLWELPSGAILVAAYHPRYLEYRPDEQTSSDYNKLFRVVREIAEGKRNL